MDDAPGRLLVVDDNEMNRDMLSRRLSRRGHSVVAVEDGKLALERIAEESFEVVLLDIEMPGIDGLEVLRRMRHDHSPNDLPIIMATAKRESEDVVKALKLGANDYVTKPLDFPIVLARVQTQLSLKRSQDALRAAHERMRRDLLAAAKVQRDLLPTRRPEVEGVRFAWHYEPCDELAGDILNVIPLDDERTALYVLDVCGHGVRSSLLSVAMTHTLSRKGDSSSIITVPEGDRDRAEVADPATVAHRLSSLFPMAENGMLYATLGYGIIEGRARRFTYTCAGHPSPVLIRAGGRVTCHDEPGLPIGISLEDSNSGNPYQNFQLDLESGDRLYLYSDALIEERSPSGELFGVERLSTQLVETRDRSLEESIDGAIERLREWVGDAGFKDDLSIVSLEIGD